MRIQNKLFLTLLITSLCVVILMFTLIRWSVDRGMLQYINTEEAELLAPLASELSNLYQEYGNSWQTLQQQPRLIHRRVRASLEQQRATAIDSETLPPRHRDPRRSAPRFPPPKLAVLDPQKQLIFGHYNQKLPHHKIPIVVENDTVGWLIKPKREKITEGFELSFIKKQNQTFIAISLGILATSIIISLPLARHLVRPIKNINSAIHQLTQGNYQTTARLDSVQQRRDELADVAKHIQELRLTLANNDNNRKRWLADTSHELRTPLSILLGEVEAMKDGIRPATTENIASLHSEMLQLKKLIDDLQALSNADIGGLNYRKETVDIIPLLESQCQLHQTQLAQNNIHINFLAATPALYSHIDQSRIKQLIDNVLNNCQKYCRAGDHINVAIEQQADLILINIDDSGPGVPAESLPQLFDHLYRVDSSRNRKTGGSGLGLAICKRIVEGHNGNITASQSHLGGLRISIYLPLARPS